MPANGWNEYSKMVLKELENNEKDHKIMMDKLNKIQVEIAMLKVKSGVWGAIAGAIPVIIAFIFYLLKS